MAIEKHEGFWFGGRAASDALQNVLHETRWADVHFGPAEERRPAYVARASAYYSLSLGGLVPWRLTVAKRYVAAIERDAGDWSGLSANQLETLASIANAGTPILGRWIKILSPQYKLARTLALAGLKAWKQTRTPLHTGALLYLDLAKASPINTVRSVDVNGTKEDLVFQAASIHMEMNRTNLDSHERKQDVRVLKGLGALHYRMHSYAWLWRDYLDCAYRLAKEVSPNQVWKIRLLRWRLRLNI